MASGATLVSTFCRLVDERKAGERGGEKHENSAESEQTVALDDGDDVDLLAGAVGRKRRCVHALVRLRST